MLSRNALMFLFSIFFCLTTLEIAEAQTPRKLLKIPQPTWAQIKGFRSARFGMTEKQLLRAIYRDFKIKKNNIERTVDPIDKTTSLSIKVPNIIAIGGTAQIAYIMGYKSKKLAMVNLGWIGNADKGSEAQDVVTVTNLLRNHFTKKRYKKDTLLINQKLDENQTIVFRGADKKDRMIVLLLIITSSIKNTAELRLTYALSPYKPDVRDISKGKF
jgi:hypothetical protein